MLYARQGQAQTALPYLEKAVSLRPDYPDALNNLGVLFVQEQRYPEAEQRFQACIQVAPNFDQAYLNLARLYVILDDKQKRASSVARVAAPAAGSQDGPAGAGNATLTL